MFEKHIKSIIIFKSVCQSSNAAELKLFLNKNYFWRQSCLVKRLRKSLSENTSFFQINWNAFTPPLKCLNGCFTKSTIQSNHLCKWIRIIKKSYSKNTQLPSPLRCFWSCLRTLIFNLFLPSPKFFYLPKTMISSYNGMIVPTKHLFLFTRQLVMKYSCITF